MAEVTLYCSCCGKRVMARVVAGQLVIESHNHGVSHSVSVPLADLQKPSPTGGLTKSK